MDDLIAQLQARLRDPQRAIDDESANSEAVPPASAADLAASEARLGFALSPLLRRIYLEVANGGFGSSYGLLGVLNGVTDDRDKNAVTLYEEYGRSDPDDPHWAWPERLLPVCHLGCAMYLCIDGGDLRGAVIWFEPNPHSHGEPWTDSFRPFVDSTETWVSAWVSGRDLFEELVNG